MNSLFVVGLATGLISIIVCLIYLAILCNRKKANLTDVVDDSTDNSVGHVTPPGANIFLELGFSPELAEKYLEDSKRRIKKKNKKLKKLKK